MWLKHVLTFFLGNLPCTRLTSMRNNGPQTFYTKWFFYVTVIVQNTYKGGETCNERSQRVYIRFC